MIEEDTQMAPKSDLLLFKKLKESENLDKFDEKIISNGLFSSSIESFLRAEHSEEYDIALWNYLYNIIKLSLHYE